MATNKQFNDIIECNQGIHPFTGEEYEKVHSQWVLKGTPQPERQHTHFKRPKQKYEIHVFERKNDVLGLIYDAGMQVGKIIMQTIDAVRKRYPHAILMQNGGRI